MADEEKPSWKGLGGLWKLAKQNARAKNPRAYDKDQYLRKQFLKAFYPLMLLLGVTIFVLENFIDGQAARNLAAPGVVVVLGLAYIFATYRMVKKFGEDD